MNEEKRFAAFLILGATSDDCTDWAGGKKTHGYPIFWFQGRGWRASRYLWQKEKGPIPEGLWVLHRCNNRVCLNLRHLYLGTPIDNMHDTVLAGRQRSQKLDLRKVQLIKGLFQSKRLSVSTRHWARVVAPLFDVSAVNLRAIVRGGLWGWAL